MSTPAEAFVQVVAAFGRLAIPYLVGGSVASSVHGISRPTMNVDVVAALRPADADRLVAALGAEFYADAETMREAIGRGLAFNLIHYRSTFKIDVFPLGGDEYSRQAFDRRQIQRSRSFGPGPMECSVAAPEDVILRKLEWYRAGGESSERQWNDLRGVVKVRGAGLDTAYLRKWAPALGVADLLDRLLTEDR